MKSKHLKKIFFIGVLICLFTISIVQAQTEYTVEYKNQKKIIKYGEPFSVKITGVNNLDYDYSIKIEYELPKPYTLEGPSLRPTSTGTSSGTTIPQSIAVIAKFNELFKDRLTKFGQDKINKWFDELSKTVIADICKDDVPCKDFVTTIENKILKASDKKDESGYRIIKEKDIVESMLKTKPGGALIITITTKPRKWKIGTDGALESAGIVVENIDKLELKDNEPKDKDIKDFVANHIETKTIRFEFEGPKGITFSFGPYLSFFLKRYAYDSIKNPNFEEGSTDDEKKSEYYIGYTEESDHIYGIAAFWNAPFGGDEFGVCWGVAYNLQEKLDKGINGLVGLYIQPKKSPALLNFGIAVGQVENLADGYEINAPIGKNEKILLKTKLKIGAFLSISFKM